MQGSNGETENRLMNTGKLEEGEGEMYGKSNMETYITICKLHSQWEFAVWLRKFKQGLCINLARGMGWGGRWEGGSKGSGYMYTYG